MQLICPIELLRRVGRGREWGRGGGGEERLPFPFHGSTPVKITLTRISTQITKL